MDRLGHDVDEPKASGPQVRSGRHARRPEGRGDGDRLVRLEHARAHSSEVVLPTAKPFLRNADGGRSRMAVRAAMVNVKARDDSRPDEASAAVVAVALARTGFGVNSRRIERARCVRAPVSWRVFRQQLADETVVDPERDEQSDETSERDVGELPRLERHRRIEERPLLPGAGDTES
ncbi:MAG TPA: hypothetical protein VF494_05415 [Candidatus Limnocylindrales bacterium]